MEDFKRRAALARAFYACWRRLAKEGACDALDSYQCVRIYFEWRNAGMPLTVLSFITTRANAPAEVMP